MLFPFLPYHHRAFWGHEAPTKRLEPPLGPRILRIESREQYPIACRETALDYLKGRLVHENRERPGAIVDIEKQDRPTAYQFNSADADDLIVDQTGDLVDEGPLDWTAAEGLDLGPRRNLDASPW